jgi:hypothetical protein
VQIVAEECQFGGKFSEKESTKAASKIKILLLSYLYFPNAK